jgi:hypothetical protein
VETESAKDKARFVLALFASKSALRAAKSLFTRWERPRRLGWLGQLLHLWTALDGMISAR